MVIDIAQVVASFASFGAMSITVKVGGAAVRSGYFVSLVGGAAAGDVVLSQPPAASELDPSQVPGQWSEPAAQR